MSLIFKISGALVFLCSFASYDVPSELGCIIFSYIASFWVTLHPIWAKLRPKSCAALSELSWALLSYAAPFWATPHPTEYWAMPHPTELCLTLNELRGTLKNVMSPVHRIFADPHGKIMVLRKNPAKIPVWQKNPLKHTTAYIVLQSNCRWHCDPSFFSN